MNRLYIVMHRNKREDLTILRNLTALLQKEGFRYGLEPWTLEKYPELYAGNLLSVWDCEAVLSVGGDGTFLQAAAVAVREDLPIYGINIGRLGFLTEIDLQQFASVLPLFRRDEYRIRDRMMLEAQIGENRFYALNDVVVGRGEYAKSIDLDVCVNGETLGRFVADGYIVSTPTGSTGYAISAGGPIVTPDLGCMVLVPICAHTLQNRAVMISPQKTVTIAMHGEVNYQAAVYCDGRKPEYLEKNQQLVITEAEKKVHFICFHEEHFFELVHAKLNL